MMENEQRSGSLVDDVWSFLSKLLPGESMTTAEDTQTVAAKRESTHPASNAIQKEASVEEVRAALSALLDAQGEAAGAHLRVLGLHTVKSKVGEQWPKFRRTVHMTVENVLAKSLTKDDRFMRAEDDLYVIAYAKTDAAVATQRTDAIAAAVLKHLLGAQTESAIAVRAMSGRIKITDKGALTFSPLGRGARPDGTTQKNSISGKAGDEPEVVWSERDANGSADRERRAMEAALRTAQAHVAYAPGVDTKFSFMPIWNARKGAITNYTVLPFGYDNNEPLTEHRVLGRIPSDDAILELDLRCLRLGITEAAKLYDKGAASLICVQVNYRSLVMKTGLRQIIAIYAPVPDFLKKYLSIQIVGVPVEFSVGLMSDIVATLRPHFRGVVFRAPSLKTPIESLLAIKMNVLTFVHTDPKFSDVSRGQLKKILEHAKARQIAVTLEYLPNVQIAREARELGVTFIAGFFISPPKATPPAGFRLCDLEDFPLES